MGKEAHIQDEWIIVSTGGPYLYVGHLAESEDVVSAIENGGGVWLHEARQIQTIVIPAGNQIGQENLVGPIGLCAGPAVMFVRPKFFILPDEKTVAIIEEKVGMAHSADIHDRAKRAGLETDVSNVRSIINRDGFKERP